MTYTTGVRDTSSDTTDHILDIEEGIKYLNPRHNGIRFVKKLLENANSHQVAKSLKHEWRETTLPPRSEVVTIDGSATTLTVADSSVYQVGGTLRIENEVVSISALASATTLTVVRGALGTSAAAHTAKPALNMGYAGEENGTGPESLSTNATGLYNYVQTFETALEMSDKEIAQLSSEMGNPFNAQLERLTAHFWKQFGMVAFKGVRYATTRNSRPLHYMGGIDSFLSSNVVDVSGAMTNDVIDEDVLLPLIQAGGMVDTLVMSPARYLKLSKLDTNLLQIGKGESRGGDPIYTTWRSAAAENELDIIVDHSVLDSELYALDTSDLALVPLVNNGINGRLALVDATENGASGKKKVLRGHYTLVVNREAGQAKAINLT